MLHLTHIYKTFHTGTINETTLYHDFNLSVKEGDFISVIGSNGSGKSTLLNLICGTLQADKGSILLEEKDITNVKAYKRSSYIARVYQNPSMGSCASFSILENMAIAENKGKPFLFKKAVNKDRIDFYKTQLEKLHLGLENRIHDKVGNLSGGQRQALAMITSTLTPNKLLILDEHTAALDPKTADNIMELTNELILSKKLTTLMVTHNLKFALKYGNRLIMMHQGKAIMDQCQTEKQNLKLEDLLDKFNEISIESGN
ncbi:ABC transporter ATP-binding protein [Velocimicrobium porci]|uniref:ATP-binding cassette domain-containing protein n=1 Tax=Velocimicrobium porci TaxID=2606634 RepID=A0A6L5Y0S1_9FIRM|nr:ATP-binding cassette domain-containing protein [Velocimicrobium porci]MSS64008.1 ATP-binding cassette domain-containing protein [Velocimicrobium porci]